MPNNRQWATIVWFAVLLLWALSQRSTRASILGVLRMAVTPKILGPLAVFVLWVAGLVHLASRTWLWDGARATDTTFWFVTAGLVVFGRFNRVSKEPHFVRRTAMATLELSAMVEVLSEVYVLHFIAELILQPVLAVLSGLSIVAAQKAEHRPVKRLTDGLILLASVGLLLYVLISLVNSWDSLDKSDLLQQFALPVWLTAGVLPYIYALGLVAAYEVAFLRINWRSETGWWARTRAKLVLVRSFHVRASGLGAFSGRWQLALAASTSFREGRQVIQEFRQAQLDDARAVESATALVELHAGSDGVDEHGRRLDRREFAETSRALRWVATCHMGWYRRHETGRYRDDLLDFALDSIAARDLPQPHGVEMSVSADGQKWFAWRRTISGWVFAIGADGAPPNQGEYDGAEPPAGFPGEDPAWGSNPFGQDHNPNW